MLPYGLKSHSEKTLGDQKCHSVAEQSQLKMRVKHLHKAIKDDADVLARFASKAHAVLDEHALLGIAELKRANPLFMREMPREAGMVAFAVLLLASDLPGMSAVKWHEPLLKVLLPYVWYHSQQCRQTACQGAKVGQLEQ